MAGYDGYKMSWNAVDAYDRGERPWSKWSKADLLDIVEDIIAEGKTTINFSFEKLKKVPLSSLRVMLLSYTGWHHTSKFYNSTYFYEFDFKEIEKLTDERIEIEIQDYKEQRENEKAEQLEKNKEEKWECTFLEWGGTRRHPKAKAVTEIGIIRGNWFHRKYGKKKSINARGFVKNRRIEE